MNILIIDDKAEFISMLKKDLFIYFSEYYNHVHFHIQDKDFSATAIHSDIRYAFIDIDLNKHCGITLAKKIKESNPKIKIIFISSHTNLIHESFIANPLFFVRKAYYKNDIQVLFNLLNKHVNEKKILIITDHGERSRIFTEDIIFIETQSHKLLIHTFDGIKYDNRTLKNILNYVPTDTFFQVHKSYIININYLHSFKGVSILLEGNKEVRVGRAYKSAFNTIYRDYLLL